MTADPILDRFFHLDVVVYPIFPLLLSRCLYPSCHLTSSAGHDRIHHMCHKSQQELSDARYSKLCDMVHKPSALDGKVVLPLRNEPDHARDWTLSESQFCVHMTLQGRTH